MALLICAFAIVPQMGARAAGDCKHTGGSQSTYDTVESKLSTCKDNGYETAYKCKDCDKYFTDVDLDVMIGDGSEAAYNTWKSDPAGGQLPLDPEKHENSSVVNEPEVAATCQDGHKAYIYCSDCNTYALTATDVLGSTMQTFTTLIGDGTEAAFNTWLAGDGKLAADDLTNQYHKNVTVNAKLEPKCNANGVEAYAICDDCGKFTTEYTYDDATELYHFTNYISGTVDDWKTGGGFISEDFSRHVFEEIKQVDPTCTTGGTRMGGWHCTVCDRVYNTKEATSHYYLTLNDYNTSTVLDPLGHDIKKVPGKDSDCEKTNGYKAAYMCDRCKKYFSDKAGKQEIGTAVDYANWIAEGGEGFIAAGHKFGALKKTVPATCEKDGTLAYKDCSVCKKHFNASGKELADIVIPKLGHKYSDEWEKYDADQHKRICENDAKHIEYAEHSFGDADVVKKADDGAEGELEYTCEDCGFVMIEKFSYKVIKGAGGTYTLGSKKNLTITADGDFDKFIGIKIDGKDVAESNYTAKSGSTIVTLKSKYLEKLAAGKHKITYLYSDGSCSAQFNVAKKSTGGSGDNPKTNDPTNIVLVAGILVVAIAVAVIVIVKGKRKQ